MISLHKHVQTQKNVMHLSLSLSLSLLLSFQRKKVYRLYKQTKLKRILQLEVSFKRDFSFICNEILAFLQREHIYVYLYN